MDVYVLFAQREERYEGEYAPEALTLVDSFTLEETSLEVVEEEYIEDWNKRFSSSDGSVTFQTTFVAWDWIKVTLNVDVAQVRKYLLEPLVAEGKISLPPKDKSHPSYGGITVTQGRTPGKITDSEIKD